MIKKGQMVVFESAEKLLVIKAIGVKGADAVLGSAVLMSMQK